MQTTQKTFISVVLNFCSSHDLKTRSLTVVLVLWIRIFNFAKKVPFCNTNCTIQCFALYSQFMIPLFFRYLCVSTVALFMHLSRIIWCMACFYHAHAWNTWENWKDGRMKSEHLEHACNQLHYVFFALATVKTNSAFPWTMMFRKKSHSKPYGFFIFTRRWQKCFKTPPPRNPMFPYVS